MFIGQSVKPLGLKPVNVSFNLNPGSVCYFQLLLC
jgi:hypothetical protein